MIYWITTSIVALAMLASAASYMFSASAIDGIRALGFPDFFRVQLAVLKTIGAVVLIVPNTPLPLKEWAYAGIGLFLLTAIVAHFAHGDHWGLNAINAALLAALIASRLYLT